ncbi:hypothetical protein INR49_004152 [Caranx melampygus]|nr:hypothetical protein INR49_004152 [Caranx melampygus]
MQTSESSMCPQVLRKLRCGNFPHQCSSARENENVPEPFHVLLQSRPVQSSPVSAPVSFTGVLAVGAVAHVLRVELHLDGDAVETKLGVEQVCGLLQHRLRVGSFL